MKKILIIEDDATLQEAVKISLTNEGFEVVQALDGKDGKTKAKSEKPDLILLDLILPEKDGYHLLKELHEEEWSKNIPVIIFTVIDSEVSNAECECNGAVDYIVKSDLTLKEVVDKVKKYIK